MSFTRRSFLALSTLVSLRASAYALDPEAYAKANLTLNIFTVPLGVTATMTQTVTQYPYGPPSYFNFTKSGDTTSAVLETASKKKNSHAVRAVQLTLKNTSSSVASFTITVTALAHAGGYSGGKSFASTSIEGYFISESSVFPENTGDPSPNMGIFTFTGSLDPGQEITYHGQNFIQTEVPLIGDFVGG